MIRRPARTTVFPYTTLSRSARPGRAGRRARLDGARPRRAARVGGLPARQPDLRSGARDAPLRRPRAGDAARLTGAAVDRKSTRLNSSHANISYAVFCLKKIK